MSPHNSSSSSSSTEGSAYPWILEHLLTYPSTYEIPLRTMYTLNSAPSAQQPPRQSTRVDTPSLSSSASSLDGSPQTPEFPVDPKHHLPQATATDHFKQCLMEHISQLPSQPCSLPPAFITSFVRRCFTEDLAMVDFTQSLTALDYLKDLENRRKRELTAVLQRLGIDEDVVSERRAEISYNSRISEWVNGMHDKERKVEALYTQVYIGLRRWTLINEMRLEPFSKANSIAMLNTLYPPATVSPPTRQLTQHILSTQRAAFFRYITGVENNGREILKNLELQGAKPEDRNGWKAVREVVDKYLRTANGLIDECGEVTGASYFSPEAVSRRRNERKADSGVSFATSDRPSTSSSDHSHSNIPTTINKPLPASPPSLQKANTMPTTTSKKRERTPFTTLEKIAREIRSFRGRNDVKEISNGNIGLITDLDYHTTTNGKESSKPSKGLRKMKSTSSIRDRENGSGRSSQLHSRNNSNDEPMPDFDFDARRRQMIREANKEKEGRAALLERNKLNGASLPRQTAKARAFD
ncbi:uncharacterized protein KY384_005967 [Bacidia gigantensis]|uniref:uncharacterized protein n=1 Tax=Bacidia gigantensis TaxID=2732470 RepID=UPI001D0391A0|nr:uncharacterized protein KY384_005967 [Bacidia gigantensis]KAG8529331.1 hypothetical protein KY384_005967 [Bacidia gigantensis]